MKRLICLLALCLVFLAAGTASATHWTLIHQDAEAEYDLYNLHIVDEGNLFFTSDHWYQGGSLLGETAWVYYSNDGGATLNRLYGYNQGDGLFALETDVVDIYMMSATQGYWCGLNFAGITTSGPMVKATLDGGYTWDPRDTFPTGLIASSAVLSSIDFLTPTKGFAVGTTKHSFTTDDGGATWIAMPEMPSKYYTSALDVGNELRDIAFDGANKIYVTAGYSYSSSYYDDDDFWDDSEDQWGGKYDNLEIVEDGELFMTADNGLTWTQIYDYEAAGYEQGGFIHIQFLDAGNGWMTFVGTDTNQEYTTDILYTTDGAQTWFKAVLPTDEYGVGAPGDYIIMDVAMLSMEFGWAVGYNIFTAESVILTSTDGGKTWEFDDYQGLGELRRIEMYNNRRGWAMGGHLSLVSYNNLDNEAPIADAGTDRSVNQGATVALDGTGSYDPDGDAISYFWELTDGANATLDDPLSVTPSFTAATEDVCYVFELTVTDALNAQSEPDDVVIAVGDADCEGYAEDDDDDAVDDDDDDNEDDDDDDEDDDDDDEGCCG